MIKFTIRLYSDISPQTNKLSSLFEEIYHLYIRSNIDYGNLTIIKISIYDYIIISCILLYFHCDDEASSQSRFGKKAPTRGSVALFLRKKRKKHSFLSFWEKSSDKRVCRAFFKKKEKKTLFFWVFEKKAPTRGSVALFCVFLGKTKLHRPLCNFGRFHESYLLY